MRISCLSLLIIVPILTACQPDQEKDKNLPPVKEQQVISIKKQTPAPQLKLNLSKTILKEINTKDNLDLHDAAPTRLNKDAQKQKQIAVSTGLLFDKNNDDLLKSVAGGEIKISVPLD